MTQMDEMEADRRGAELSRRWWFFKDDGLTLGQVARLAPEQVRAKIEASFPPGAFACPPSSSAEPERKPSG